MGVLIGTVVEQPSLPFACEPSCVMTLAAAHSHSIGRQINLQSNGSFGIEARLGHHHWKQRQHKTQ